MQTSSAIWARNFGISQFPCSKLKGGALLLSTSALGLCLHLSAGLYSRLKGRGQLPTAHELDAHGSLVT